MPIISPLYQQKIFTLEPLYPKIKGKSMKNFEQTLQSQYSNSKKIIKFLEGINTLIDPIDDIALFYNHYFLVENAQGVLLDIWGRIVEINRAIKIRDKSSFGFLGQDSEGFNNANFIATGLSDVYNLADDAYKTLILLKIGANIAASNAQNINQVLQNIFIGKTVYVLERKSMVLRYVFEFLLEDFERAILEEIHILPNGAGVGIEYLEILPEETFGFFGSELSGFNESSFMERGLVTIQTN